MEEKVKSIVNEFFAKVLLQPESVEVEATDHGVLISIQTLDERGFLGRDGERFDALSTLLKKILGKEIGEEQRISFDVNGQKAKRDAVIISKARIIAERARSFKMDVEMEPMSSYERMVIHTALEGLSDIETDSIGEGKDRRVVVKYKKVIEEAPL